MQKEGSHHVYKFLMIFENRKNIFLLFHGIQIKKKHKETYQWPLKHSHLKTYGHFVVGTSQKYHFFDATPKRSLSGPVINTLFHTFCKLWACFQRLFGHSKTSQASRYVTLSFINNFEELLWWKVGKTYVSTSVRRNHYDALPTIISVASLWTFMSVVGSGFPMNPHGHWSQN